MPTASTALGTLEGEHGELTISIPSVGKPLASTKARTIFRAKHRQSAITLESTDESVRSLIAIDSAFAPERWSFTIGGDAEKLALLPDGGVIALNATGGIVAGAPAPWAVDAKGKAIPTHFEVRGTTLTQVVKHRPNLKNLRTPTAYPVVADPSFDMNFEAALQRCAIHAGTSLGGSVISDLIAGNDIDFEGLVEPALNACLKGMTSGTQLSGVDFSGLISSLVTVIETGNFDLESIDIGALRQGLTSGGNQNVNTPVSGLGSGGFDIRGLMGESSSALDLSGLAEDLDLASFVGSISEGDITKLAQNLLPMLIKLLPLIIQLI